MDILINLAAMAIIAFCCAMTATALVTGVLGILSLMGIRFEEPIERLWKILNRGVQK